MTLLTIHVALGILAMVWVSDGESFVDYMRNDGKKDAEEVGPPSLVLWLICIIVITGLCLTWEIWVPAIYILGPYKKQEIVKNNNSF